LASLKLTFSDVYTRVSEFLGLGSSPTGTDLTRVKNIVHSAYRRFLSPVDPVTGNAYVWSFRHKFTQLETKSGQWVYEMPDDYGYLVNGLTLIEGENYPNPEPRSAQQIYAMRTAQTNTTGYVRYYGVKAGDYSPELGQVYEWVVWPEPDAVYNYYFTYVLTPPKLANDTDMFIGDVLASECIQEIAMAVAEQQEDDVIGIHTQNSITLLNQMIAEDKKRAPQNLGLNLDPSVVIEKLGIQRPNYRINDVNYS
jgi:hypothetical protein